MPKNTAFPRRQKTSPASSRQILEAFQVVYDELHRQGIVFDLEKDGRSIELKWKLDRSPLFVSIGKRKLVFFTVEERTIFGHKCHKHLAVSPAQAAESYLKHGDGDWVRMCADMWETFVRVWDAYRAP